MERVYWKFKLEEEYFYQSNSILHYLARPYLFYWSLDSLLFYQDEPTKLKELYTDTVVDFDLRYATVEENGKERTIYPIHFHIPDTNVYYSRTLHYLVDSNQRFTQIGETDLKNEIGSNFFNQIRPIRDRIFKINQNLVINYFNHLYQQKKIEDEELEYLIKNNHPRVEQTSQWPNLKQYLFFFSATQRHARKNRRMQKRNEQAKENSSKFVKRFFDEYK